MQCDEAVVGGLRAGTAGGTGRCRGGAAVMAAAVRTAAVRIAAGGSGSHTPAERIPAQPGGSAQWN